MLKEVNVINLTAHALDEESFKGEVFLMLEELAKLHKKDFSSVNVCLMASKDIKKLNKKFLGKDLPTDTLSFLDEENPVCGDVAVCPEVVKEDAERDGRKFEEYFSEVVLHGLFHLFGLEHDYSEKDLARVYDLHRCFFREVSIKRGVFSVEFN